MRYSAKLCVVELDGSETNEEMKAKLDGSPPVMALYLMGDTDGPPEADRPMFLARSCETGSSEKHLTEIASRVSGYLFSSTMSFGYLK